MRAPLIRALMCVAIALAGAAAAVACADSSNDNNSNNPPPSEAGLEADAPAPHDSGAGHDSGEAEADAGPDGAVTCSPAGWCLTPLPDVDLQFVDIAPFRNSALALTVSESRGTKVMEWDDTTNKWAYLDVGPIELGGSQVGNFSAPSKDEIYISQVDFSNFSNGGFAHYVYHATRPKAPAGTWTWTRYQLCNGFGLAYVWGSSSGDVYAMSCSTIYHLKNDADAGPDGSTATWAAEYVDDDPTDYLYLFGGAGTGPDDAWFIGARGGLGNCGFVVHKTSTGYKRIADGVAIGDSDCTAKPGFLMFSGGVSADLQAIGKNRLFGVWWGLVVNNQVVDNPINRIVDNGGGSYTLSQSNPSPVFDVNFSSIWGTSEDDLWLIVSPTSGGGAIMHGTNAWSDGGVYQYSTLALNGAPNPHSLARIRGTSDSNLWAVGYNCAYHKTTP